MYLHPLGLAELLAAKALEHIEVDWDGNYLGMNILLKLALEEMNLDIESLTTLDDTYIEDIVYTIMTREDY